MRESSIEALEYRYGQLKRDTSFEEWRALSQDVLAALVEHQGLVIALQRRALENQRSRAEDRGDLRMRAEAAFAGVQRLHQLRRRVHGLLAERRSFAANDRTFALVA